VTGAAGNAALGLLGLLLSIPMLRRLYLRFGTWRAPAVAVALFMGMFALSAFVIGPALAWGNPPAASNRPTAGPTNSPAPSPSDAAHAAHHSE
jgi:hypothetical protein